ncbi:MAG TPA: hypothetical protein VEV84_03145 [Pyrinomonadaceae bacterium]|jgi:hypothetical protein|nr:hypothetical protein [Pyrinomonadaceae bacterium]
MDENNEPQVAPDEDRTPTQQDEAPTKRPSEGWVMPEPVFRQSSGYLPKGFEERVRAQTSGAAAVEQPAAMEKGTAEIPAEPAPSEDEFAAPPDIAEDSLIGPAADIVATDETPQPRKKRGFFRWLLIILALLLAVGIIAAIAAVGVFWYFYPASESQTFN